MENTDRSELLPTCDDERERQRERSLFAQKQATRRAMPIIATSWITDDGGTQSDVRLMEPDDIDIYRPIGRVHRQSIDNRCNASDLISINLIKSTQFVVAATDQNDLGRAVSCLNGRSQANWVASYRNQFRCNYTDGWQLSGRTVAESRPPRNSTLL